MKLLDHPHVIKLREAIVNEEHVVIVMEFAAEDDLLSHVRKCGRLSEDEARELFRQLVSAIDYCHQVHARLHGTAAHRDR
jgi:MAP/microtubule affinity-regulating kinase